MTKLCVFKIQVEKQQKHVNYNDIGQAIVSVKVFYGCVQFNRSLIRVCLSVKSSLDKSGD